MNEMCSRLASVPVLEWAYLRKGKLSTHIHVNISRVRHDFQFSRSLDLAVVAFKMLRLVCVISQGIQFVGSQNVCNAVPLHLKKLQNEDLKVNDLFWGL